MIKLIKYKNITKENNVSITIIVWKLISRYFNPSFYFRDI
jgi:hypothetical protein